MSGGAAERRTVIIRWAAVAVWMGVIFYFSHQSGGQSAGLSEKFSTILTSVVPGIEPEAAEVIVRKGAHVTEYAILGALLTRAWAPASRRLFGAGRAWAAGATGVAYAISDEVHQLFVPGRAGQATDVLIDSVGVALGVLLITGLYRRRAR